MSSSCGHWKMIPDDVFLAFHSSQLVRLTHDWIINWKCVVRGNGKGSHMSIQHSVNVNRIAICDWEILEFCDPSSNVSNCFQNLKDPGALLLCSCQEDWTVFRSGSCKSYSYKARTRLQIRYFSILIRWSYKLHSLQPKHVWLTKRKPCVLVIRHYAPNCFRMLSNGTSLRCDCFRSLSIASQTTSKIIRLAGS